MSRHILGSVVVVCLALAVLVAACTGDGDAGPPPSSTASFSIPPVDTAVQIPTVTVPEGFVLVDARGVNLTPFDSNPTVTTPPLPVLGGAAEMSGQVSGPDGPVGASVMLERVVGDRSGSLVLVADADGRYKAEGIHGGKYRVRAWLAPTLASPAASLVYLVDQGGQATVDLDVDLFTGRTLQIGLDITALNVGDTAQVRALLTDQVVDDRGIVVGQGIGSAAVVLTGAGSMQYGEATTTTNADGLAAWTVTCEREGTTTFTARAEGATGSFTAPSCGPKPIPSVDVPSFPVGQEFDVPRTAVLPSGSYETFLKGCKTSYQVFVDGSWQAARRTATGSTMVLAGPARDFQAADGTQGCSYRRTA